MKFDSLHYNYTSRRNVVYGKKGMVATSQPLAAQIGLDVLKKGGNAIDAAIATAACLTVVEPTSNGIGGDAFALVWTEGKLHGLNSSGFAPKSISIEKLIENGYSEIPRYGLIPVTVPGAPAAWVELSKRFGKLPFKELLEPAILYAKEGYPISPNVKKQWNKAFELYSSFDGDEFKGWFETFAPHGRPPEVGEVWKSSGHAETLKSIADTKGKSFYSGNLADKIDKFFRKHGGYLRKEDLEAYKAEWVEPIKVNYKGYDVWEIPPNGQGIVALMALNILKGYDFKSKESVDTYHKQIEAMKLAFIDGQEYVADIKNMSVRVRDLLSEDYGNRRRKLIKESALMPKPGQPSSGGTVYLAAADGEGNMISYIQSNYTGFGSGVVVPGTGISLQNRGHNFSFDPNHDNCLAPGKRPYHTIIPGFLTKDNKPVGPFGVMGGFMQPQGHVQVIMNTIDFNMNPQDALDAPRWQWVEGKLIKVEQAFANNIARRLMERGHNIQPQVDSMSFGRGQIIWRMDNGVLCGGTEPRTDGSVVAW
ncbi:MAG: gamma-glutamyltransferase [Firmicutes bacterium]|nr:gamma-glutamyltransferase [Bacillota bacterium]